MLWPCPPVESIFPFWHLRWQLHKQKLTLTGCSKVSVQEGLLLQAICWKLSSLGEKILSALQLGKSLGRNCLLVHVFTVSGEILSEAWHQLSSEQLHKIIMSPAYLFILCRFRYLWDVLFFPFSLTEVINSFGFWVIYWLSRREKDKQRNLNETRIGLFLSVPEKSKCNWWSWEIKLRMQMNQQELKINCPLLFALLTLRSRYITSKKMPINLVVS